VTLRLANQNDIVVVDDNEIDIRFIEKCLTLSSLRNNFLSFTSGIQFLDYMNEVRTLAAAMPAMILIDIKMPDMDGFEVVSALRVYPQFNHLPPIVLLTTSDNPSDKERATSMQLGYVEKFLNRGEAIKFLESLA